MDQDYGCFIAEDEVGPCTPTCCPRTTCPGHVVTPSCDSRVVVQEITNGLYFDEQLSRVTTLLDDELTPAEKGTAIKSLTNRVFSKVRSDIVRLMGKTNRQVTDDKAAGVSQLTNIMSGGPMWRNEHEMRACKLLGWDASKGLLCNAIDTAYRIGTADCAQLLLDDNDDYRTYGTGRFSLDKTCALDCAVRNHIGASSDDPYSHPTDLAVGIVLGMRDDTKFTFLLVPDFMVRQTLVIDTWCPTTCCFLVHMCSYVQV